MGGRAFQEVIVTVAALVEQLLRAAPSPAVVEDVATWWAGHHVRSAPTPAALCATEKGGVHPRAIATALEDDGAGGLRP